MRESNVLDRSAVARRIGSVAGLLVPGLLVAAGVGCGDVPPPAASAPRAAARADHHHDHDHDHDHGEESKHAKGDDHDDHDHDDAHSHPETLAAAVGELKTLWGHVKGSLKAGDREKADEKVHAVGHLLEHFESLLAKGKAESREIGMKATQEVFDCFDKLDTAFHGAEEDLGKLDLDALGGRLEAAIKTLEGMAAAE